MPVPYFVGDVRRAKWAGAWVVAALTLAACQPAPSEDDLVREIAEAEGTNPKVAVSLEHTNEEFYENRPTESLFAQVVAATKHPNPKTRVEAFTTLATLRGTAFHRRAIREIDRMPSDASPEVRDRYVWVSYLAEHPNADRIRAETLASGSPEAQRLAKLAESYGPREPKRSHYGNSKQ